MVLRVPTRTWHNFWSKVEVTDTCWLWTGRLNPKGYPIFDWWKDGRTRKCRAHKLSYQMMRGPVANGLDVDHLCRVRHCVNPTHLEAVSHRTNLLRGNTVTARNAAVTQCPRGHKYTTQNTRLYQRKNGTVQRNCRACGRKEK